LQDKQCVDLLRAHGIILNNIEENRIVTGLKEKLLQKGIVDLPESVARFAGEEKDVTASNLALPEVCGYNLRGLCFATKVGKYACVRLHSKRIYHWQVRNQSQSFIPYLFQFFTNFLFFFPVR
jgi:hypothetical protein